MTPINNSFQCIYCKKIKKKNDFNREHVIPKSFGVFGADTLTLNDCVCEECNSFFSKNLENILGRDTIFGLAYRGISGISKPNDMKKSLRFNRKRFDTMIFHSELGMLIVDIHLNKEKGFDYSLANQILVSNSTKGRRVPFRISRLPHKSEIEAIGLKPVKDHIIVLANPDLLKSELEKPDSAINLSGLKLKFNLHNTQNVLTPKEGFIYIQSWLDDIVMRTIAKIAFNYLAKVMGADFVLGESFDDIRNYIRYGLYSSEYLVAWDQKPVIPKLHASDTRVYPRHIVLLTIKDNFIKVKVSLLNDIYFDVILSRNYPILYQMKQGTLFDVESQLTRDITSLI